MTMSVVLAIHDEQLAVHGGSSGLRDVALLELALGRPRNKWAYEKAELPELAAAYGYGIARNHPFVDGNKRTALLAMYTFLGVNNVDFHRSRRGRCGDDPLPRGRRCERREVLLAGFGTIGRKLDGEQRKTRPRKKPPFRPRRALCAGRRQCRRRGGALCRPAAARRRARSRRRCLGARLGARQSQRSADEGRPVAGDHSRSAAARIRRPNCRSCKAKRRPWAGPSSSGG